MTGEAHAGHRNTTASAILGIVLIAIAIVLIVPVAINLPESWPGIIVVLSVAGTGAALIISHLKLGHRSRRKGPTL